MVRRVDPNGVPSGTENDEPLQPEKMDSKKYGMMLKTKLKFEEGRVTERRKGRKLKERKEKSPGKSWKG